MKTQLTKLSVQSQNFARKLFRNYIVFKNFLALSFFVTAFMLIVSSVSPRGQFALLLMLILGVIVLVLCCGLAVEFAVKSLRLQNQTKMLYISPVMAFNAFFGLLIPGVYFNLILSRVIYILGSFHNYNTIFCEFRQVIVRFYFHNALYWQISNLLMITAVMILGLILFGTVLERALAQRK